MQRIAAGHSAMRTQTVTREAQFSKTVSKVERDPSSGVKRSAGTTEAMVHTDVDNVLSLLEITILVLADWIRAKDGRRVQAVSLKEVASEGSTREEDIMYHKLLIAALPPTSAAPQATRTADKTGSSHVYRYRILSLPCDPSTPPWYPHSCRPSPGLLLFCPFSTR